MLIGWIAAVIGIIIVVFSLNQLIREIRKAGIPNMEDQSFSDTFYSLLNRVEKFGDNLDDINQTFYESTERLEKRMDNLERKTTKTEPVKRATPELYSEPTMQPSLSAFHSADSAAKKTGPSEDIQVAAEIRKLLNEGKDSQQVAKELNLGVGEVELIRRLRSE